MAIVKVRYQGVSDVRTITKKEFASVGVTVDEDVTWSAANSFTVLIDANERMEEVLREQGHFKLSAQDDAAVETVIATATDVASEGDVLVDGTTGDSTKARRR